MMENASTFTDGVSVVVDTRSVMEVVLELGSLGAVSLVGIVGNILVLSTIVSCRDLKTSLNAFIFNLGIADLLICSLVIPMVISARARRMWLLGDIMCTIQGFINFVCLYASLFFLAAIAFHRFIETWLMKYTQAIYTRRNTGVMFLAVWLISVTAAVLPVFGWGRYAFDNIRDICTFDRMAAPSYSLFLASVGIVLPWTICAVSYILVLIHFLKHRSRIRGLGVIDGSSTSRRLELKLARNVSVVWLVFFVCWAPMTFLLFFDPQGLERRRTYVVCVWLLLCNSCLNPIIHGFTNKKFRKGYRTIVVRRCLFHRKRRRTIHPACPNVRNIARDVEPGRPNPNLIQARPQSPRRY